MTDPGLNPPTISTTVLGYLKPVLTAAVTRGLLGLSVFLAAHGVMVPAVSSAQVSQIVLALIAFAMWVWGLVKAYLDHRVKAQLQASPAVTVKP
jgi:hypothetical protein